MSARRNRTKQGRKPKLTPEQVKELKTMAEQTGESYLPMEEIAKHFDISRASAYRYLDKD